MVNSSAKYERKNWMILQEERRIPNTTSLSLRVRIHLHSILLFIVCVFVLSTMSFSKPFSRKKIVPNIESYAKYKKTNGMDYRQPINTTLLFAEYGHSNSAFNLQNASVVFPPLHLANPQTPTLLNRSCVLSNKYLPNREREEDVGKIRKFFAIKQLICKLKNPDVPLYKKMETLEERNYISPNIYAGGLMKDFDFGL